MAGTRKQIIGEARRRISAAPDKYIDYIYGESEVGGTSHVYLSAVPFDQIGFRKDLGTKPYPEYSAGYLNAVPLIATLTPLFMLAISAAVKMGREDQKAKPEEKHEAKGKH
jgi:hypothetical protein